MPTSARGTRRAVFFDRDGVVNAAVYRDGAVGSPRRLDEFALDPAFPSVVGALHARGFLVFVVTNQPDVPRGLLTLEDLEAMHARLRASTAIDDLRACLHDDADDCRCRKPRPGAIEDLAAAWSVDVSRSFMVGDSWRDAGAGQAVGCDTIMIDRPDNRAVECSAHVLDLHAALAYVFAATEARA